MCLNYLSLFSGVGAFEKALQNISIDYNLLGFSEIDKFAISSYCAIHNVSKDQCLGDITKININTLPKNIDLLTHGSPCTSFSLSGKNLGGDKGSGTPSSLLWNSVDIIESTRPTVVIWENVPNVLSNKHKHNFENYLTILGTFGYTSTSIVLNSKYFNVAQNRNRLFCISILDSSSLSFKLSSYPQNVNVKLRDILDASPSSDLFLSLVLRSDDSSKTLSDVVCVGQTSNKGSQAGKVYSIDGIFPTLCACTHGYALGYILDKQVRKLSTLECFKLMGFDELDYQKCKDISISDTQLYKQMGNSVVVPILEFLLKCIYLN